MFHINPYTGVAYKDNLQSYFRVTNECDLFTQKAHEPTGQSLKICTGMGKEKIKLRRKRSFTKSDKTMLEFFIEVTEITTIEMIAHMRQTGVKINNRHKLDEGFAHLSAQVKTDFTDITYTSGNGGWRDNSKFGNARIFIPQQHAAFSSFQHVSRRSLFLNKITLAE